MMDKRISSAVSLDREHKRRGNHPRFDVLGTLMLALTLAAYALVMTVGRGSFGGLNVALLLGAAVGAGLFILTQAKVSSPLIPLAMFRNPTRALASSPTRWSRP